MILDEEFNEAPAVHSIVEGKAPDPVNLAKGDVVIASAATIDLTKVREEYVDISGSIAISALAMRVGQVIVLRFASGLTLTHGAALLLPGGGDIDAASGDMATFRCYAEGVVRCTSYSFGGIWQVNVPIVSHSFVASGRLGIAGEFNLARESDGAFVGTDKMVGDDRIIDNSAGDIAINWGGGDERIRTTADGTEIRGGPLRVGQAGRAGLILVADDSGAYAGEIYSIFGELYIDCPLDDVVIARGLVERLRIGPDGITTPGYVHGGTIKPTSAGGYKSSDSSAGITTTITTDALVGKTITIKDGLITGFA